MKKYLFAVALAVVLVCSILISMLKPCDIEPKIIKAAENSAVLNISNNRDSGFDSTKVLESRFLNMLNRNFVYGEAFNSVEAIVNSSMSAILNFRDAEDESFISEAVVSGFIFDMYGVKSIDYGTVNRELPKKESYVYIIPRGFTVYTHKIISITANEDGSFFVNSEVTVSAHDDEAVTDSCKTLFVPNSESAFGYSIISSDIGDSKPSI